MGEYVYSLYPTDRPESKGNLMLLLFEEETTQEAMSIGCNFRQWPGRPGGDTPPFTYMGAAARGP